jgi:hypothetical protein
LFFKNEKVFKLENLAIFPFKTMKYLKNENIDFQKMKNKKKNLKLKTKNRKLKLKLKI